VRARNSSLQCNTHREDQYPEIPTVNAVNMSRYRPPFRGSAIPDSEAEKNLHTGSVVRVSASYRPSSKVVGCGEGSGERQSPLPR